MRVAIDSEDAWSEPTRPTMVAVTQRASARRRAAARWRLDGLAVEPSPTMVDDDDAGPVDAFAAGVDVDEDDDFDEPTIADPVAPPCFYLLDDGVAAVEAAWLAARVRRPSPARPRGSSGDDHRDDRAAPARAPAPDRTRARRLGGGAGRAARADRRSRSRSRPGTCPADGAVDAHRALRTRTRRRPLTLSGPSASEGREGRVGASPRGGPATQEIHPGRAGGGGAAGGRSGRSRAALAGAGERRVGPCGRRGPGHRAARRPRGRARDGRRRVSTSRRSARPMARAPSARRPRAARARGGGGGGRGGGAGVATSATENEGDVERGGRHDP